MPIWKSNLASLQRGAVSSAGRGVLKVRNLKVVDSESPHATADVAPAASPRPVGTYSLSLPSPSSIPSPSPSNRRSASRASSSPRRCHGAHCGHHWHRDLGWHCHYHFQCQRQASGVIVFVLAWADPSSRRSAKGTRHSGTHWAPGGTQCRPGLSCLSLRHWQRPRRFRVA